MERALESSQNPRNHCRATQPLSEAGAALVRVQDPALSNLDLSASGLGLWVYVHVHCATRTVSQSVVVYVRSIYNLPAGTLGSIVVGRQMGRYLDHR